LLLHNRTSRRLYTAQDLPQSKKPIRMKYFIAVAFLATALIVNVVRADSESESEDGDDGCRCVTGRRASESTCYGNTATGVQKGCPGTNKYVQCDGANCTAGTCPVGQVWAGTACASCATGKHVRADGNVCVCNMGTTLNFTTGLCGPCPTGATVLNDSCSCPSNTLLDFKNNACKPCPSGSTQERDGGCDCTASAPAIYWQASSWTCQSCPGTAVTKSDRDGDSTYTICNCTGPNAIFLEDAVICYTCVAPATSDKDGDSCVCPIRGQDYDMSTGKCACDPNEVVNAAGNACQRVAPTTAAAAASGRK
jgi:hypothetical protein